MSVSLQTADLVVAACAGHDVLRTGNRACFVKLYSVSGLSLSRKINVKTSTWHPASVQAVAMDAEASETKSAAPTQVLDVLIESEVNMSYDLLQQRLAAGEWEEADNETRRLLCVLAGEGAAKRKWIYFTEVKNIPSKDLLTIDRLWRSYSGDKFGFSVQRRMWKALDKRWKPLFLKIGWTFGENSTYKKFPLDFTWDIDAPVGHLPLTNALRGIRLIDNLLQHPAFAVFDSEQIMPEDSKLPEFVASSESDEDSSTTEKKLSSVGNGSIFDEGFNSADYGF